MDTQNDKSALITGATKGMGLAIVHMLAAEGYHLFLTARSQQALSALKNELEERYAISAGIYACDFLDEGQVKLMAEAATATFSRCDVLVNNVGIYRHVSLLEEDERDFLEQWQVNFRTAHYLCKQVGRRMREAKAGYIFNISSIASRQPVVAAGSYTVTKFALAGLTAVLREELAPFGVKVTEVIPGSTLTASWDGVEVDKDKFILPQDIASAIKACLHMSVGAQVDEIVIRPSV